MLWHCRDTIRSKLVPKAVSWYTGEEAEDSDEEYEDDEDDDEDDDDEDDEVTHTLFSSTSFKPPVRLQARPAIQSPI